ncbi:MAG: hypothetical protein Q7R73_03165 [bacterium]|nr:hypothetical protein [bacterium]
MKQKSLQIIYSSLMVGVLLLPMVAVAQTGSDLQTTLDKFTTYALRLINFLLVLATLVFLWGIIKYITAGGDAAKVKEARTYIIWGLVALLVMGAVWALASFLRESIGLEEDTTIPQDIYKQGSVQ